MPERNWKQRMRRRMLIRIAIFLLILGLVAGAIWVFVLPYRDAQSHMPLGENMTLRHISGEEVELAWPAAEITDYYLVEVLHQVEVENKKGEMELQLQTIHTEEVTGATTCVLRGLPWDEELTVRVNTMVGYEFPGEDKVRPGDDPLEITLKLQPPVVTDVAWEPDTDAESITVTFDMEPGDKARLWYQDEQEQWQLLRTLETCQTIVTFGEQGDLPVLEHGKQCYFKLDAYREQTGSVYYSLEADPFFVLREDLLDRDLWVELTEAGDNVYSFHWNETKGEYYELQRRGSDESEWTTICTVSQTGERTYTTEHMKAFRDYDFRVVAQGGQATPGEFAAFSENIHIRTREAVMFSTIWPIKELEVYSDPAMTESVGKVAGGTTLCVVEKHDASFGIRWENGTTCYIDSNYVLSVLAVLLAFVLVVSLATMLLQPKYMTDLVEGSFISQYYREAGDHDVVFIGDCEVYANFSPMELYRQRGITAYVRGTSQQLIWQSYHILEETFRYETPKVIVWNVNAMRYSEPVSEAYNRLTIDRMRWSREKVDIILASMTEEESFLSYVFPILRYHSRFDKLTEEDFTYFFREKDNTFQGYQMNKGVEPVGALPRKRPLPNYDFGENCWDYLDKMRQLCQRNGAELVLIKAPSVYPYWYDEYDAQIEAYAQEHGLAFYNFLDYVDEIGIDYSADTYDAGLHMNLRGATKLSAFFANILAEEHGLVDHRNNPKLSAIYNEKLRIYEEECEK